MKDFKIKNTGLLYNQFAFVHELLKIYLCQIPTISFKLKNYKKKSIIKQYNSGTLPKTTKYEFLNRFL